LRRPSSATTKVERSRTTSAARNRSPASSTGWSWSNLVSCRFHDGEPIPPKLAVTFPRRSMPSVVWVANPDVGDLKLAGTSAYASMRRGADLPHRLCGLAGSSTTRQRPASGFLQDLVEDVHGLVGGCGAHADAVHDVQVLVDVVAPVEVQGIGQVLDIDHIG
jgi:hypothetical protein